jgi:hypothetical protein
MPVFDNDGWLEVVDGCRNSLTSLKIMSEDSWVWLNSRIIDLPKLCHLELCDKEGNQCSWGSNFITPALKTYIETTRDQSCPVNPREALKSITHLRLSRAPSLSMTQQLQILQLSLSRKQMLRFLDDLKISAIVFPQLELLEFSRRFMRQLDIPIAKEALSMWNGNSFPRLVSPLTISEGWSMELSDEDERAVRN